MRRTSTTVRGSSRPHLRLAKGPWVSPHRLPPGGRQVLGADLMVVDHAACAGEEPELFFAKDPGAVALAKHICGRCLVREACLARAIDNGERFGVFGGLTADERQDLKDRREAA
ncbi:WhiB family transcriptional regulator [Streptomyces nondiastaticus]|uniref:Transcriptional regulator WhiB n=1 Tax=Streptomyces nondiastaticus TaxID=3154512 RepID=A0ABW6U7V0_9ACTN